MNLYSKNELPAADAQPQNASRRKILAAGMGAAASAGLGGMSLLMPTQVQAQTNLSCSSMLFAISNMPKMKIIYRSGESHVAEDCAGIEWVSSSKIVGYDSASRKAYSGIMTQIKKSGFQTPTQRWTLQNYAALEWFDGQWVSSYYKANGERLLRLTKDELLNPVTYNKSWSKQNNDQYHRRVLDNPNDQTTWTPAQIRDRLVGELRRIFARWHQRLDDSRRLVSSFNIHHGFTGNFEQRWESLYSTLNIGAGDIWQTQTVGNEPPTLRAVNIYSAYFEREPHRTMFMVRDVRRPDVMAYYVLVVVANVDDSQILADRTSVAVVAKDPNHKDSLQHVVNPVPSRGMNAWQETRAYKLDSILGRMNQHISSESERMGMYSGSVEIVDHNIHPPGVPFYNIMPFQLINSLIGHGGLPSAPTLPHALPADIINQVANNVFEMSLDEVMRDLMNEIDADIAAGIPWMSFEFGDDNAGHRRLVGYTLDKATPPTKPVITGECRLCPSDDDLANDAW